MYATSAFAILTSAHGLVRVLADEYTPGSVAADPADAARLRLVKADDGNYAIPPITGLGGLAASRASAGVQAGLCTLRLGG